MEQDYLINKWLNHGLTKAEFEEFRKREDYEELVSLLDNAKSFKASNFSEAADYETFKRNKVELTEDGKSISWMRPLLRIAAVLVLGVAVFYFLSRDEYTVVNTMAAEKESIELPDASNVVLNAQSEIRYKEENWEDNRVIELKGEAFFDVESGGDFKVVTSSGIISVLGTEFNIKERNDLFEVHCFEGRVEVQTDSLREILELGELLRISKGQLEMSKHSLSEPGWTNFISSFERVPVAEVIAEIERQYDLEIELKGVDPNSLFTGAFVHDNLENALKSVTEPMELEYRIETDKYVSIFPSEH